MKNGQGFKSTGGRVKLLMDQFKFLIFLVR
jgi:hypothetical protein